MKKIIVLFIALGLLFSFASCKTEINVQEPTTVISEEDTATAATSVSDDEISGADTGTDATYTGYQPVDTTRFQLPEGADYSQLSHNTINFSYGSASGGEPSSQTVYNQKYMEEHGFGALCYDNKTEAKVLYLTFDVGYENGYTGKVLDVLKEKNVPAAFFCTKPEIAQNPEIAARMIKEGHIVGNHSVTHPDFSSLSQEEIIAELQGFDDYVRENFGYSSKFFRYPQGKYSDYSEQILTDLGFTSVFWSIAHADWDLENQPDTNEALSLLISRLHPGAVILLHAVSPVNYELLPEFINEARALGYEFVALTEYKT